MSEVLSFPGHAALKARTGRSALPLSVRQLTFRTEGIDILRGINLSLESNDLTVLMGPNGAGKSVFLRLIHGLLQPSSGDIRWDGAPLSKAVRRKQALVFQKPVLLRRSVRANLAFALGLRGFVNRSARLEQALADSGLADLADRPARVLSGGEQQRLALARALILDPKVLFLDEPTANLDPASVLMIEDVIGRVRASGVKIILVTHDAHQARRLGEEVVFLHKGRVSEHSPADLFFNQPQSAEAEAYLNGNILV